MHPLLAGRDRARDARASSATDSEIGIAAMPGTHRVILVKVSQ